MLITVYFIRANSMLDMFYFIIIKTACSFGYVHNILNCSILLKYYGADYLSQDYD